MKEETKKAIEIGDREMIEQIKYNWTNDGDYQVAEVGREEIVRIEEHRPAGEGDKWFFDIYLEDETIIRVFNINEVIYTPGAKVNDKQAESETRRIKGDTE